MLKRHPVFLVLLLIFSFNVRAQKPVLKFLTDSVLVGEPVKILFYYQHKSDQEIIFPDSNFNYIPFEFISKEFFPTKTVNGISTDSAIYTLALFEVEGIHSLSLPVTSFDKGDTSKIYSTGDSIAIRPLIHIVSDTLKLRSNTAPVPLESDFNYLILVLVLLVLAILAVLVYILFGKRILKLINRYRAKIEHRLFISSFTSLISNLNSADKMEEAVSLWKKYLERLEHKPYTTYTSTEIAYNLKNESIKKNLQNIDIAIYSGKSLETASKEFDVLLEVANNLYIKNISTN